MVYRPVMEKKTDLEDIRNYRPVMEKNIRLSSS